MEHNADALSALAKRADDLHSLIVKHSIVYIAVGLILVITLTKAKYQVELADLAQFKQDLQAQVDVSGDEYSSDKLANLCTPLWDTYDIKPDSHQETAGLDAIAAAKTQEAKLIGGMKTKCDAMRPYIVETRLFDFPFNFDLQYWIFAVPMLFLPVAGYLSRLWYERRIVVAAGRHIYALLRSGSGPSWQVPLDGALTFSGSGKRPSLGEQTTTNTELLLGFSIAGLAVYVFVLLYFICSQLDKMFVYPLVKIYGLMSVALVCFLIDCSTRLRRELEEWVGDRLPINRLLHRFTAFGRMAAHNFRPSLRRAIPLNGSALAAGCLGVASLFLAAGVTGCQEVKVDGYELLKPHSNATWYFTSPFDDSWNWFGRATYAAGVCLAVLALLVALVSIRRRYFSKRIFSHTAPGYLILVSSVYCLYELAWSDYLLGLLWIALAAFCFSLAISSAKVRLWFGKRWAGGSAHLYGTGLASYNLFLALLGVVLAAKGRFWGVVAFVASQFLMLLCVDIARASDADAAPPLPRGSQPSRIPRGPQS